MTDTYEDDQPTYWETLAKSVVGLDTRSLALFRILIGILMLFDLYDRAFTISDFQTDDGFLTRAVATDFLSQYQPEGTENTFTALPLPFWSFHLINGELEVQQVMLGVQAVVVVMFLVGWKTRFFTIVAWLLLVSLHVRNPVVLNSGDTLLRTLLFWSIFLPLGARWSADHIRHPERRFSFGTYVSVASGAFIVQLCLMYFFTGLSKFNDVWLSGDAVSNVLNLDLVTRPWARGLATKHQVTGFISLATVWLELLAPFVLFIPWKTHYFRCAMIVTFWLFHAGIMATMDVGLFSLISMAAWVALIPREFWNSSPITGFLHSILGTSTVLQEDYIKTPSADFDDKPIYQYFRVGVQVVCGLLLAYVTLWNIWRVDPNNSVLSTFMPSGLRALGQTTMLAQEFKMFDRPPNEEYWFVFEGRLANGESVDLFSGAPVDLTEKPNDIFQRYRDHRWRRLHYNMTLPDYEILRKPLTEYLIKHWNETHAEDYQVTHCTFRFFKETAATQSEPASISSVTWVEANAPDVDEVTANDEAMSSLLDKMLEDEETILP